MLGGGGTRSFSHQIFLAIHAAHLLLESSLPEGGNDSGGLPQASPVRAVPSALSGEEQACKNVPGRRQRQRGARGGGTGSNKHAYASAAGRVQRQRQPAPGAASPLLFSPAGRWPPAAGPPPLPHQVGAASPVIGNQTREEQSERERKGEKRGKRLSYVAS